MKKTTALFTIFAIICTFPACSNLSSELHSESTSGSRVSVTSNSDNIAESASDSGTSVTSNSDNIAESTTASKATSTESGDVIPEDKPPEVPIPDDFAICDYITDFDDVELMGCSYVSETSIPLADETAVDRALDTYFDSVLYREAHETAVEMFHFENGELIENDDFDGMLWFRPDYKHYIIPDEMSELTFKPDIMSSYKFKFDRENEESLVLLRVPLPESCVDWSGHASFHIPVYVNANGDAQILYDVSSQDFGGMRLISYSDGTVHVLFNFGHNEASQRGAIYSFKDGKPKQELADSPVSLYNGMLMNGYGWRFFEPFLYDKENDEFCGVAAVSPSRELAEIICSDKTVLSYVPDAWESYKKDRIQVIGGKYITFVTGIPWSDNTFIYNSVDKCFERVEQSVTAANSLPEQITKSYNVRL